MKMLWKRVKLLEIRRDSNQTKMDFYAVLIPTFLSKELFKSNREIKEVTDKFRVKTSIKDYLFDSRTALLARLIREVEGNSEEELEYNINVFKQNTLALMEEKGLETASDVTKIINKYSRNNKDDQNE